ncbi:signal peptidase I [Neobacillus sp. OS1-2]|uniref:signal peptidase I SipW n=1 Tax=Neobacillus sp. OS1-2 TaxID=3070680 RepID=UPI0027DFA8A4|nr:signal peptidase I [Neobacillus sp. OS1-2]WML40252.1 signal peptidase I [Neobacillus sp. OS1-2]
MNKVKKWLSNIVTIILFMILIVMLYVVISSKLSGGEPQAFGYELKTVLSGSMEPGIKTGSIIAVKPGGDMTRFTKGDVITFRSEDNVIVTHRITDVLKEGDQISYKTKGDNNKSGDLNSVPSYKVLAEYNGFTIPFLGYFADYTKSKMGGALLLIIPGLLLLAYSGISIWKAISQLEKKSKNSLGVDDTKNLGVDDTK